MHGTPGRAILAVALAAASLATAPASAAVIAGPQTGGRADVPVLVELSAPAQGGRHVAAFLDANPYEGSEPDLFGRVVSRSGRPLTSPVQWNVDDVDVFWAEAAVTGSGDRGLAIWHQDRPSDPAQGDLVIRPFDPRTARPTAAPEPILRATRLYGAEPFGDGYYVLYRRRVPGIRSQHVLQRLDERGRPAGEPEELSRSRNAFDGLLYGDPRRRRVAIAAQQFSHVVDLILIGPDGDEARKRIGGLTSDYLLDMSRAVGGAWMTLWAREDADAGTYRVYTRRLTAEAKLGRPVFLPGRPTRTARGSVAFNSHQGVVLLPRRGRCPSFDALPIDNRGRAEARQPQRLRPACDVAGRIEGFFTRLVRASLGNRFLLGFSVFGGRAGKNAVSATGLRVRG